MLRCKYFNSLPVLIILAVSILGVDGRAPQTIIGGSDANIKNYPSMVHLQMGPFKHLCAGTLISSKHVLTAAHCVTEGRTKPSLSSVPWMRIVPGEEYLRNAKNIKHYYIKRVDVHRTWGGDDYYGSSEGDIAILTLDKEVPESEYKKPAVLPEAKFEVGDRGTIVGWGWTHPKHGPLSRVLQKATLRIIDPTYCRLRDDPNLTKYSFCALGDQLDVSFCEGDSGGPMFNDKNEVIGVISNNYGCTGKDANEFTDVFRYKRWIQEVLRGERSPDSRIYTTK